MVSSLWSARPSLPGLGMPIMMDESDSDEARTKLPWPKLGDRPFRGGGRLTSALGWARGRRYGYVEGYRDAARLVFAHIERTDRGQESLVFPLVFLWRQHVELRLKELIELGHMVLEEEKPDGTGHHLIQNLWARVRALILRIEPGEEQNCRAVDGVIEQLAEVDPGSFDFRYHESTKGDATLGKAPDHVDLRNLQEVMEGVARFLDCGSTHLSVMLDGQQAMAQGQPPY